MDRPGIFDLGTRSLTTALTGEVITAGENSQGIAAEYLDRFAGISELDVQIRFAYGSGGTSVKVYVQTSLDQGQTWIDLWCFAATTASKTRARRLKPDGNEVTPTDGALADDTVAAGIVFGDMFRAKVTSVGTYANSTVSVRMHVR